MVDTNERIAPSWINRVTATRSLTWAQRVIAAAIYRAVRDELAGGPRPTISGIARDAEKPRDTVRRRIGELELEGWVERRIEIEGEAPVWYLTLRVAHEPPVDAARHACETCDGTGWQEIAQPPGAPSGAREQPWVVRCRHCGGSGWLAGPEGAPIVDQMSDHELIALWALHDLERRADGRIYRIEGDARLCPTCLGVSSAGCEHCRGRGFIGVPAGQRVNVQPPERDSAGRWVLPPLPDGTRPSEPVGGEPIPGLPDA